MKLHHALSCTTRTTKPKLRALPLLLAFALSFVAALPALAQAVSFAGAPVTLSSGGNPTGVTSDSSGNVFYMDVSTHTLFEIPYNNGSYGTPVSLWVGSDPSDEYPDLSDGVAVDAAGNIFVAVVHVVAEIPKNGAGYGAPVVLTTGINQAIGLAIDANSNLYIADFAGNSIDKMSYSSGSYSQPVQIASVQSPWSVAVDSAGNVYSAWGANVLENAVGEIPYSGGTYGSPTSFGHFAYTGRLTGVAVDGQRNIYFADYLLGYIKELPYTGGAYGAPIKVGYIHDWRNSLGPSGLAVDSTGQLYFTGLGNVIKSPPAVNFGSVAAGAAAAQTLTFGLEAGGSLGAPRVVAEGVAGQDFSDAGTGNCTTNGTGYIYQPDQPLDYALDNYPDNFCTVTVRFQPSAAGVRTGSVQIYSSAGALLTTAYLYGTGVGPQVAYAPGAPVPLGSGFASPQAVAVDSAGNVFVADTGNGAVKEVPSSGGVFGAPVTLATGLGSPFAVALDGAGNVYVADSASNTVKELPVSGTSSGTFGAPVTLAGGYTRLSGLAVDGLGDVFIADGGANAVTEIVHGFDNYANQVTLPGGSGFNGPSALAVDGVGNVYVADSGNGAVKKIPYAVSVYGTPVTLGTGYGSLQGLAVDGVGNVYVPDHGAVTEIPYTSGSYGTPVLVGSGVSSATGLAVDGSGNVYFADTARNAVDRIDRADAPTTSFATTAIGNMSTDSPRALTLTNSGNGPLNLSSAAFSGAPNYVLDGGTNCLNTSIPAGGTCVARVDFQPALLGSTPGLLTLTDRTSFVTTALPLNGTATAAAGTTAQTITFPQPVSPVLHGSTMTLAATSSSGLAVVFRVVSGPATVTGSSITYTSNGTVVIEADQYGNSTYAAATPVQRTITVGNASATGTTSLLLATVTFSASDTLGSINVLTQGSPGKQYQEASPDAGTCAALLGKSVIVSQTCTVQYTFTPSGPGALQGGIVMSSAAGANIGNAFLFLSADGPQPTFPPGRLSGAITAGISGNGVGSAAGLAVDAAQNVFVVQQGSPGAAFKTPYIGGGYGGSVALPADRGCLLYLCSYTSFNDPSAVALDGSGNVFVADTFNGDVAEIRYNPAGGGSYGPVVRLVLGSNSSYYGTDSPAFKTPTGVAVDGSGNVYVADPGNYAVEEIPYNGGKYGSKVTLGGGFSSPSSVAVDQKGNVFVMDDGYLTLMEIPVGCASASCVVTLGGLAFYYGDPHSVSVDGIGNVYVTDAGFGNVQELPWNGSGYGAPVLLGDGIFIGPSAVVVDTAGNIYANEGFIDKLDRTTAPAYGFSSTPIGQTSVESPQTFTLANTGTKPLVFSSIAFTGTPAFLLDGSTTCSTSTAVAVGASCQVSIIFKPAAPGPAAGTLTLASNSAIAEVVALSGTGTQGTPTITAAPTASAIVYGQTLASSILTGGTAKYNGTTIAGTFTWNTPGTSPSLGTASYLVTFTPTDATDYNSVAVNVSVVTNPDSLASFQVTGIPAHASPGTAYTATVKALGASGSVLTTFQSTVTLSTSDASAAISPSSYTYTAVDNGTHTFQVTFNTAGTYTLTVSSGAFFGTQTGITVGGYIWVAGADGQLQRLTESGSSLTSGAGQQATAGQYGGVAFDAGGSIWSVESASNNLIRTSNTGGQGTPFTGGGLNAPVSVAVDGSGTVWVANSGNGSVSAFTGSGTALSGTSGLAPTTGSSPSAVVVDQRGGVWVANRASGTVTHIFGAGTPVVTPTAAASNNAQLGVKP